MKRACLLRISTVLLATSMLAVAPTTAYAETLDQNSQAQETVGEMANESDTESGTDAATQDANPNQALPSEKPPERIRTRLVWSQFADVPVSGDAPSTFRYGGKIDAYVDVKGSVIGLDDSISVHFHPEFKYGESSVGEIGLIPANSQLFYPGDGDVFDLSVNVTKRWNSGTTLTVGKINLLDLAARIPVLGGGGHEGFQNAALALPPSAIVPGSATGALLNIPTEKVLFRVLVFDPDVQSRRSGLENPFSTGVGVLASATFPVKIGGKQGYYGLKIASSTRNEIAADALPAVLVPAPGSGFGDKHGEFAAVLNFQQMLTDDKDNPGKGIGLFGQLYLSGGDPAFLDTSGFIGIGGNPHGRPQDRFGLTYFRYSLTDDLVDVLGNRLALEDEEGVEVFYTLGLSESLRITANLQVVDSAIASRKVGITTGLRITTIF